MGSKARSLSPLATLFLFPAPLGGVVDRQRSSGYLFTPSHMYCDAVLYLIARVTAVTLREGCRGTYP